MVIKIPSVIGLAGVSPNESLLAIKVARFLEWPMLFLAVWILISWYAESTYGRTLISAVTDWLIWVFFTVETLLICCLVNRPSLYIKQNWLNILIIIFACPLLWIIFPHAAGLRALRLVVLITLLVHMSGTFRKILSRHNLGATLVASFFIILMAGTVMSVIDDGINTPMDGIWWAWVTVTTVGYGDIVPNSDLGRLFGSVLILMGIGLLSILTASFAAFFMSEDDENLKKLNELERHIQVLEDKLDSLIRRK